MNPTLSEFHRLAWRRPAPLLKSADAFVNAAVGCYERRRAVFRQLSRDAERVDALAEEYAELTDFDLTQRSLRFRDHFRRGGSNVEEQLLPALATIRELARRKVGLYPFRVQLMGTLALHRGFLAEMGTGEGKTLTAGLAAILAGWTHLPCHVITVNDYLVKRDSDWLAPLFQACGVRVGTVTAAMPPEERIRGYQCDVTYTTSKEVLADFLRDRLRMGDLQDPTRRLIRRVLRPQAYQQEGLLMRGLHHAIVDEADSVLIDEAVTPLIISSARKNDTLREACQIACRVVGDWKPEVDYTREVRYREVELTREGRRKLQDRCDELSGLWRGSQRRIELVKQALVAREFFVEGSQYVVEGDKIVIVDEFTGRPMPQRSWQQGLHQAVEAKAGLAISDPTETIARMSFQRFFRCYYRLSGMTGTAREAAGEFWQIYRLPVVAIPPNRPCIRVEHPDRVFSARQSKWEAIADEIDRVHRTGRPLLVGTRNVSASEQLSVLLQRRGLVHRVLNATRLAEEAAPVATAGEPGRITIATNMAGRGTDIKLGRGVSASGGLHVIATERHESRRIDRQLFGRTARQGDPGSAQAFVSLEDDLLERYLPTALRQMLCQWANLGGPAQRWIVQSASRLAQSKAQSMAYQRRKSVLRTDQWLEESFAFSKVEG